MVVDRDGSSVGPDGTSKSIGNPLDLQLLFALRSKTAAIVTTGATARIENYKSSRFAPIAFITRDAKSIAEVPAIKMPGGFENILLGADPNQGRTFVDFDATLRSKGFDTVLFEGGRSSLTELLQSGLHVRLVLSIANGADVPETSLVEIFKQALPEAKPMILNDCYVVAQNLITRWSTY